MICAKCGNTTFEQRLEGPHIGIYCTKCGAWKKWIKKSTPLIYTDLDDTIDATDDIGHIEEDDLPWN